MAASVGSRAGGRGAISDRFVLQVRKGNLVFDPFAGTGSILIAAAHLGAYTLGSDIDIRVLRDGRTSSSGQVCHPAFHSSLYAEDGLCKPTRLADIMHATGRSHTFN